MRDMSNPVWTAARRLTAMLAVMAAALSFLLPLRPAVAAAAAESNALARTFEREQVLLALRAWPHLSYPNLTVYYAPHLARDAAIVGAAAQQSYSRVLADFGLPPNTPAVLVVVSAAQLAQHVGVSSTLGDYYDGVIWLLAPSAFLPPGPGLRARYDQVGPVVHELTHLADDLAAGGLPPVWFDEGLAQYEDWRLTGYVWSQSGSGFEDGTYSWRQLTSPNFYQLSNLALAFRQALAATAAICRSGPGACNRVLADLRSGMNMDQALQATIGPTALHALERGAAWRPGEEPEPGAAAGPRP